MISAEIQSLNEVEMKGKEFPILEYDGISENIIEPSAFFKQQDVAEHCIMCFYSEVIEKLLTAGRLKKIKALHSQMGAHPVYAMEYAGQEVAVFQPGVGAPLSAGLMEEVIASGGRKFICCGSAGVLNKDIAAASVMVPTSAVRDEGTSYHYIAPSREISVNRGAIEAIEWVLQYHNCQSIRVKTWSTDSFYRETKEKMKMRKDEGCLAVEMECAALCAVAQYRDVMFGQILYGGDDISCDEWNFRGDVDRTFIREALFWFAVEACLRL